MTAGARRPDSARLAVFVSGAGRTLENLVRAIERDQLPATIGLVVASRPCKGVEVARRLGLEVRVIEGDIDEASLVRLLDEHEIGWVALAGYLRLLPVPERWAGRVVNIHPALLPHFGGPGMYGDRVHRAVLESGARESGCTVHQCDGGYDTGAIVLQVSCPVLAGDTPETLAERVFELETQAYPAALRGLIERAPGRACPAQEHPPDGPTIEERQRRL